MAKTIKEERLRWVRPIVRKKIRLADAALICPYSKRSLERWIAAYRKGGIFALEPKSTRPRTNPKETPIHIKEKIISKRKELKKCALKLKWELEKEGIKLNERTIGKILKNEKLTRRYRLRRIKYKYIRQELKPGEIIEIDVKYVPQKVKNKRYFQYTAIDCASRWRYLKIYEEESTYHSLNFLGEVQERFPYQIQAIKTDNHSIFTNWSSGYPKSTDPLRPRLHPLDIYCQKNNIIHYLIDPGHPAQNGMVERSHRSDQESFYDHVKIRSIENLKYKLRLWNMSYNNLEHCSLGGRTPNEMLASY